MESIGLAWFISALAFAVSMSATPGPNNTMLTASGANFGLRRTVPHMVGVSVGFPAMLLAVALGAGELLRAHPVALAVLRWAGAAYLLWLAWRIATARPAAPEDGGEPAGRPPFSILPGGPVPVGQSEGVGDRRRRGAHADHRDRRHPDRRGRPAGPDVPRRHPGHGVLWTLIGVGAARVLRTPRALRGFNIAMAALLVASLLPLLWGE